MSDLRSHLLAVAAERGQLTPSAVVAAASAEDHPLHNRFEWDDTVAGHKYRIIQAGKLIRSVKITYETQPGSKKETRAFLPVISSTEDEPDTSAAMVYEPTEQVVADPIKHQLVVQQMKRDWNVFRRRYEHLEEFAALINGEEDAA